MNTVMMQEKLQTVHPDDRARAMVVLDEMEIFKIEVISDCIAAVGDIERCASHEDLAMVLYHYDLRRGEIEDCYRVAHYARQLAKMVEADCEIDLYEAAYKLSLN